VGVVAFVGDGPSRLFGSRDRGGAHDNVIEPADGPPVVPQFFTPLVPTDLLFMIWNWT
jgi:hypothetical protein